ncbi:MAG: fused MFS/spermidine synthase [Planctomycetota bacterium]
MVLLLAAVVFVSAVLLFAVQPMAAREILPLLGGSPAVWNTSMVFFQAALLGGYAYAHASIATLGIRRAAIVHVVLVGASLVFLPIGLADSAAPPASANPSLWVLLALAGMVGGPFFVLSATSSLTQRWLAHARPGRDPYWLYAASNAGSMLALLSYPLLVEPALGLAGQERWWSIGYLAFAAMIVLAAALTARLRAARSDTESASEEHSTAPIGMARRARWVLLAAVPSSLMLGVTQYVTTDVASAPLLWVLPLSLYLLTFVLAFGRAGIRPWVLDMVLVAAVGLLAAEFLIAASLQSIVAALAHLTAFALLALSCHTSLAADRPPPRQLTEFFLWVSVGGVVGGATTALLAPLVFNGVWEYPFAIVLALVLRNVAPIPRKAASGANAGATGGSPASENAPPSRNIQKRTPRTLAVSTLVVLGAPALVVIGAWMIFAPQQQPAIDAFGDPVTTPADTVRRVVLTVVGVLLPLVAALAISRRRVAFALTIGGLMLAGRVTTFDALGTRLATERTFFGVHRVVESRERPLRSMMHGTTIHGGQYTDHRSDQPTLYYHESGPIGALFRALGSADERDDFTFRRIGIVGLGAGGLAAYAHPAQRWTFYEIDPVVRDLAEDTSLFTFLADARARGVTIDHVGGDGRLRLGATNPGTYDLLILDAFSSDAIPVHLLTVEAIELYERALAPRGLMLFNISNRHVDMAPILAASAEHLGLHARHTMHTAEFEKAARVARGLPAEIDLDPDTTVLAARSTWVLLARDESVLDLATVGFEWRTPSANGARAWTDDYSNLLGALKWFK